MRRTWILPYLGGLLAIACALPASAQVQNSFSGPTGGIRIINENQTVRNNYLYGLTGHRFRGALVIMNGVPNSPRNKWGRPSW